jgi:hypothetical protein
MYESVYCKEVIEGQEFFLLELPTMITHPYICEIENDDEDEGKYCNVKNECRDPGFKKNYIFQ